MKIKLLYLAFLTSGFVFGQDLILENFNTLALGDITQTTGWEKLYLIGATNPTTTNQDAINSEIIAGGLNGTNALRIVGPNADTGAFFTWKNGFETLWANRTTGNDILEFDISFGILPDETSTNVSGIYIFNAGFTKVLAGFTVDHATKELVLVAYSLPEGELEANNIGYSLNPSLIVPESTIITIGVSYNTVTGQVLMDTNLIANGPIALDTNVPVDVPAEINFVSFAGDLNTAASQIFFDDLRVKAVNSNTILNTTNISKKIITLSIFPNPTSSQLQLKTTLDIKSYEIFNYLGQSVLKDSYTKSTIDVASLAKGVYILKLKTKKGNIFTKNFVKE